MTNSLISISQSNVLNYDENTPGSITVEGNTFKASGSYYGTNVLIITKYDTSDNPLIANKDNRCGKGIQIIANNFNQIVGTCQTDTGLVRVQCKSAAYANTWAQGSGQQYSHIGESRQIAASVDGKIFSEAQLDEVNFLNRQDPTVESTVFSKNTISSCGLGLVQSTRVGARIDATLAAPG